MKQPNANSHPNDNPYRNTSDHQSARHWEEERQRKYNEESMAMWASAARPQPQNSPDTGSSSRGCFAAGTAIMVPGGTRPIESIGPGEVVLAKAAGSNRLVAATVRRVRTVSAATIWRVTLQGMPSAISTTANHRLLTERGWIAVRKLRTGDQVATASGATARIMSVENTGAAAVVFNLIVDREFTYIAAGCVVHSFGLLRPLRVAFWNAADDVAAMARFGSNRTVRKIAHVAALLAMLLGAAGTLAGCDAETMNAIGAAASDARPVISELKGEHDTRLVSNEWDYGVTVTFTLTNQGGTGLVRVMPWLSCSEGEWSRQQTVSVNAGQTLTLTYFFQEPTINSTNIQYGVRTSP